MVGSSTMGTLGAVKEVVAGATAGLEVWKVPGMTTGVEVEATVCSAPVDAARYSSVTP